MPRKRKAEGIPVSPEEPGERNASGSGVRRSTRLNNKNMDSQVHTHNRSGDDRPPASSSDCDCSSQARPRRILEPDVQRAIEHLVEMERRFRTETRRQKLQLQESVIPVQDDEPLGRIDAMSSQPTTVAQEDQIHTPRIMGSFVNVNNFMDDATRGQNTIEGEDENEDEDEDEEILDEYDEDAIVAEEEEDVDEEEARERGAGRTPPLNSSYLPLPWNGRLGYACLNTYLRTANPPVFSYRTCRMASILEHRHPLRDPSKPEHRTTNKPDRKNKPEVALGQSFVQALGLANARDIAKMIRWNDKYGIKFMRLSSEMFPFASHPEFGYKLAPFASDVLAEAGKVIVELGHRVTTHPGQYTQLGSPREEVINAAIRDLEYHDEMLSLLKLRPQQNRDAVVILHMGGSYGDKTATLARFRQNYTTRLSESIKARLVLENDDVTWSVHDLLPLCEELSIPLVLDYHHNNIIFDTASLREGTLDISEPELAARIAATWKAKGIRQKMHYSEPRFGAVTPHERRRHSNRVATLPPCPPDTDLMIEAKDKEQAVFELMRTFRLPGFEKINDIVPHKREDQDARPRRAGGGKKKKKKTKKKRDDDAGVDKEEGSQGEKETPPTPKRVDPEDFGMGGPLNRVYWPAGMEGWLKPRKRVKKDGLLVG